jgi:predicted anti-sigma-YlaC factor YlaD
MSGWSNRSWLQLAAVAPLMQYGLALSRPMRPAFPWPPARALLALLLLALAISGCSPRQYALNRAADALGGSGAAFASDEDPELIREAAPFSLKAMESLLEQNPAHVGLLTATSRGFVQYAYAFVQQDGEELEATNLKQSNEKLQRARGLYRRGRDYGLRALEVRYPGFRAGLRSNPRGAAALVRREDVALLYWSAAGWGALINLSKDDPATIAEVPQMEALIDRALALDEAWEAGAIHAFLVSYEPARQGVQGDRLVRSERHFERAMALSRGQQAAPLVALAETVSVARQDRKQFEALLRQALAIDLDAAPTQRLANAVMQRRARWLLSRADDLIPQ